MQSISPVDFQKIKAVIFDVDGTLYNQSRLRKKMLFSLMRHYALKPWQLKDMLILHHFRAEREKKSGATGDLENAQYAWCASKGNFPIDRIKKVVQFWMFQFPNKYLPGCVYPGVKAFFEALQKKGIKIGIYSDYEAVEKLKAMNLNADVVVSSTSKLVDQLKPNPKGLLYIMAQLGVSPDECLFIGDRQELDGECAIRAGMPYLIVDKKPFNEFDFYHLLTQNLERSRTKKELV
ncbi:HAD family hydrolase [Rufibacter latericius]|uniref:phosphoglycolate phosphatase n=1 Tax=Rufibacter latericius TaxID=2487040 RepID=A0A3M9MJ76_9BACT|nr:HAD family hydrolase [Rufibacter latericius]RNI25591.1 HAD family hydrolase [Rufibacter latericius]